MFTLHNIFLVNDYIHYITLLVSTCISSFDNTDKISLLLSVAKVCCLL